MRLQQCPRCGFTMQAEYESSQMSNITFPSYPREEIASVHRELRRLEDMINELHIRRGTLLRRLNETQSPISMLPPETMSLIFQYACPPIDFTAREFCKQVPNSVIHYRFLKPESGNLFPLTLGAVSSSWRQIAWSSPQLWTTILVEVLPKAITSKVSLLRLYLKNSGVLPVSLELDFRWYQRIMMLGILGQEEDQIILEPIKQTILIDFASKVEKLRLCGPPPQWLEHLSEQLWKLKDLSLGWLPEYGTAMPSQDVSLIHLPALTRVTLKSIGQKVNLSWTQIVALNLSHFPVNFCVELLVQCPNIVEFRSRCVPTFHPPQGNPWLAHTVMLHHLESLEWVCMPDPWSTALLRYVRLPGVRTLIWSGDPEPHARSDFRSFFAHLPTTLESLELRDYQAIRTDITMLTDIFGSIPHLPRLTLRGCDAHFVVRVIYTLGPDDDEKRPMLTRLEALTLRNCYDLKSLGTPSGMLFTNFVQMLDSRQYHGLDEGFCLDLSPRISWSPEVQRQLAEIKEEEFRLEIIEDSERVNWL